ncbi:MAG: hypothetical protein GY869_32810 [Planctomycetes bacterium]|nr:hypothetical protein [Planctomycetota bacterium]
MLYRTFSDLRYKEKIIPANTVHSLEDCTPEAIGILLARGRVGVFELPELAAVGKRWTKRAERLAGLGVTSKELFFDSPAELAAKTEMKEGLLARWKCELRQDLNIVEPSLIGG